MTGLRLNRLFVTLLAVLVALAGVQLTTGARSGAATTEPNPATAVAYSPDGSSVAVGASDGSVFVYAAKTGKLLRTISAHMGSTVTAVTFSPKGDVLATAARDSTVRLWGTKDGKPIRTLTGHEQAVTSLAFGPGGVLLVSGGEDSRTLVWDASNGSLLKVLGGADFVSSVAVSPDGKTLAVGSRDARITLRELATYKQSGTLRGHAAAVTGLAFAPDGSSLASASADDTVKLWSVPDRVEVRAMRGHAGAVTAVSFSPDGTALASSGQDGTVRIWRPGDGALLKTLARTAAPVDGVTFAPDGKQVLEGRSSGVTNTWDVASGAVVQSSTLPAPSAVSGSTAESAQAAAAATDAPLASGTGGPILVITASADPFSAYYAEILRAEGLTEFATADMADVTTASLSAYDVAIVAAQSLTAGQAGTLSTWVSSGGNLIAMRPDSDLAALLGISQAAGTVSNGYLKVDTSSSPGSGIVGETIQFHGTADRYTLAGARAVATLYSTATTATANPAVTLAAVGTQGGQAAAFTYDLARSIVYTRQGNPAWNGQERDGSSPIRSDDLFYGNASGDPQPDWVDLGKVAIPQADEQQRLLVNLILEMNKDRKPLPRFWYLPRGLKAAVIMTGDDHGNNGTAGRFDQFLSDSSTGCVVADWECIRGTSYIYTDTPLTNTQAASYSSQGFEIGLHVNTSCSDWTAASLDSDYTSQLQSWRTKYTSLPAPVTNRTHCIAWSDWSTQPSVELSKAMRLDTNYYFWPPWWVLDRPGFFTGSGMPMRFADPTGAMIDVYQATTQLTDESGQTYPPTKPNTIDTLLDNALGPNQYFGAFTINAHTDSAVTTESSTVVASAKEHGVPVVSAKQMLEWLDGRNSSTFQGITYSGSTLSFAVAPGTGARNLTMLIPARTSQGWLSSVSRDGSPVSFESRTVKGSDYALVTATAGSYTATYAQDTTPPTVDSVTPNDGATGVAQSTTVTATFSESVDPATVSGTTFALQTTTGGAVAATVTYDAASRTARLTPNATLAPGTAYRATLVGGATDPTVRDLAGNALAQSRTWTFTTASGPACPCSIWPTSATPTHQTDQDPNAVELGVKFRVDVDGYINGVRFWKGPQNTGTHVGSLWTTSGQRLAQATFANETSSGWQEVTFSAPVPVTANTTYVASYHTNVGMYAGDTDFFATNGVDNPPVHALAEGVSGPNGVYAYAANPTFPASSWRSSNYWVDVVFTTNTGPDTTPPTVTTTSPAAGAADVASNAAVTATFSEAIDAATVTDTTARLLDQNNTPVQATVGYDPASRTVTIQPSALLTPNTDYTARLTGGGTDPTIRDLAGNALAADKVWSFRTSPPGPCDNPTNPTVAENCRPGNPSSEWDVTGAGDASIQGFTTDISVNQGTTVSFKIDTTAPAFRLDIYRLGYYNGQGARKVASIPATDTTATNQPSCLTQTTTGLVDCGNWSVSATWAVPASATSGLYIARPVRSDTGGASHIPFVVRSDTSTSDIVFQTSDTTWQAYNTYGGNSLYTGSPDGRAYKVSYNRPFATRGSDNGQDWLFNAEYPMIRWLERNGYDVSYISGLDSHRFGSLITRHKTFLSVGHDEYWSGTQRANVEAARDAGVNLAFLSGNEVFWKTRWEPSISSPATDDRTLVCYKETHANAKIDPTPAWTGTWRDPRFSPPADGGRPENALSGTIFMVNDGATTSIRVPAADGKMRLWRGTSIANLTTGATATLPDGTLGYEWDADLDNGSRPPGLVRNSTTTQTNNAILLDYGSNYGSGTVTHALTLYRKAGGGLVFGAGTVQWSWGLDDVHDRGGTPVSVEMQQATVNLLADMSAQPATLASGLTAAAKSTDAAAPTAVISSPAEGSRVNPSSTVTISGTAADTGGGRVGAVEVSTDGGATWHPATGRETWSYTWSTPPSGNVNLRARAADDSGNLQTAEASVTVTVGSAPPPAAPTSLTAAATATGITLDWADGGTDVVGYNVYRSATATGTFTKVNGQTVVASAWDDTTAPSGASYYRVTALNSTGGESTPSAQANASMTKSILLLNPSFELDADGNNRPDSWTSSARFLRTTTGVRSGTYGGTHSGSNANYTIAQTRTGLAGGTVYDFAGWVNIPATTDAFTFTVQIQWRSTSTTTLRTETVATFTAATSGWVKISGSYTTPAGTTRAVVNMVASSLRGPIHVDDFTLR